MSTQPHIRIATPDDLPTLFELMRGYYRDDGLTFDPVRNGAAMRRLLQEPHWGRVLLLVDESSPIGYLAICIGYSLELGGNDAFIDEVYVQPEYRGRGLGGRLLQQAVALAPELGIRALHLEVDRGNEPAQRLYAALEFRKRDRYHLMSRHL